MKTKRTLDEVVLKTIRTLREKGKSNDEIANALNKAGHVTKTGKPWSAGNVSIACLRDLGMPRQKSTSRGEAGTTGGYDTAPRYSRLNGRRLGRKKRTTSYGDMEDVMTSNLSPKLKLRLIARLAKEIE